MSASAVAELKATLGSDLDAIDLLEPDECADLLALIRVAQREQQDTLDASITEILEHLPRLVRGPARKIMFG